MIALCAWFLVCFAPPPATKSHPPEKVWDMPTAMPNPTFHVIGQPDDYPRWLHTQTFDELVEEQRIRHKFALRDDSRQKLAEIKFERSSISQTAIGNASDVPRMVITGKHSSVTINMNTGHATIHGDVNEAARVFWQAVETWAPMKDCK